MIAEPVAHPLTDLGVTKSHSRPHPSNDDPFLESHFRTFEHLPDCSMALDDDENAHAHSRGFLTWYDGKRRSHRVRRPSRDVAEDRRIDRSRRHPRRRGGGDPAAS